MRKGVVGDSLTYFGEVEKKNWDLWAMENLTRLGIKEERVLRIFSDV